MLILEFLGTQKGKKKKKCIIQAKQGSLKIYNLN